VVDYVNKQRLGVESGEALYELWPLDVRAAGLIGEEPAVPRPIAWPTP